MVLLGGMRASLHRLDSNCLMMKIDAIGWYIATMHQLLGHQKLADFLGEDPLDPAQCILCQFEKGLATMTEVIERIGVVSA